MTATREHLAGLELALNRWNDGGPTIQYGKLLFDLIEQAQSAPEPVQGEALRVVGVRISTDGFGSYIADSAMGIGAAQPGEVREPLMTVAQHNRIMAAAKPDAELVELLRDKFPRIDITKPLPLDEKAHCCEYTIFVERERLHRLIDAKLASLKGAEAACAE